MYNSTKMNLHTFIQGKLDLRASQYLFDATLILEHYNIERGIIQSYNGRQLLEMVQNADDASSGAPCKTVLIKLIDNELTIANNGEPFTEDGILSIMTSNLSPKSLRLNQSLIGHKGLGFRSILSWSEQVTIQSDGIKICFSEKIAQKFLESRLLQNENKEQAGILKAELKQRSNATYPIATLRVPQLEVLSPLEKPVFTTEIQLKLKPEVAQTVQSQINELITKETILFLNQLETIEIESPERNVLFSKKILESNQFQKTIKNPKPFQEPIQTIIDQKIEVSTQQNTTLWYVKRVQSTYKSKNYALAIAWQKDLSDTQNQLFSFFKTNVQFPFKGLAHGTFVLSENRNELSEDEDGYNEFLIGELATLMLRVAHHIMRSNPENPYLPLEFLNVGANMDLIFEKFKFKAKLLQLIEQSKLFPSVNHSYLHFNERPIYCDTPIADFLSGADVHKLMPTTHPANVVFLRELGILQHYPLDAFLEVLRSRIADADYSIPLLAKLYHFLLKYEPYQKELNANKVCLINNKRDLIHLTGSVFVKPPHQYSFELSNDVKIEFVNDSLIEHLLLLEKNNKADIDSIVTLLKPLGVEKYNFDTVAKALVKYYKALPQDKSNTLLLHKTLLSFFKGEDKPAPLADTTVHLLAKTDKVVPIGTLYFGKAYGHELTEKLYAFAPHQIVAEPQLFDFESDTEILKSYFKWLGVADLPRYKSDVVITDRAHPFYRVLLQHLKYPIWIYEDLERLKKVAVNGFEIRVAQFDGIHKILTTATLETIFEWIHEDKQLNDTLKNETEIIFNSNRSEYEKSTYFYFSHHGERWIDSKKIYSYTKWQFATILQLPVESDMNMAFAYKCCLSMGKEFSPLIEKPKLEWAALSKALNIKKNLLENYLIYMGVHRTIDTFSTENLYHILLELPNAKVPTKTVKSIYREIIHHFREQKIDSTSPIYKKFMQEGHILCEIEHKTFFESIKKVLYVTNKIWGSNLLNQFHLACLDGKQGNSKIKALFGVEPLDEKKLELKIRNPVIRQDDLQTAFQADLRRFKPYVYALRQGIVTQSNIAEDFKKLEIQLVSTLEVQCIYDGTDKPFKPKDYEFVQDKDKLKFYVIIPEDVTQLDKLREKARFCSSIAAIFTLVMKVEAHRDFVNSLYNRRESLRIEFLLEHLHESMAEDVAQDVLATAKKTLDVVDDFKIVFWRAFAAASEAWDMEIQTEQEIENFISQQLNRLNDADQQILLNSVQDLTAAENIDNQLHIYNLFLEFKINNETFLQYCPDWNWTDFFKARWIDRRESYANNFARKMYDRLLNNPKEQLTFFAQVEQKYKQVNYQEKYGFLTDIDDKFKTVILDEFTLELSNSTDDFSYKQHFTAVIENLEAPFKVPENLKGNKRIQCFALFGNTDALKKHIADAVSVVQTPTRKFMVGGKELEVTNDNYAALVTQCLTHFDLSSLKIGEGKTCMIPHSTQNTGYRPHNDSNRKTQFEKGNEENIGFIAEFLVYKALCNKYLEEKVVWISENGHRYDPIKWATSEAGAGYDIQIEDKHGVIRYIEVKACANVQQGIRFTHTEMEFASNNPDKYDIIIVENIVAAPTIRHIKKPFKFNKNKDETLFKNPNLTVSPNSYLIRFNWQ